MEYFTLKWRDVWLIILDPNGVTHLEWPLCKFTVH